MHEDVHWHVIVSDMSVGAPSVALRMYSANALVCVCEMCDVPTSEDSNDVIKL